MGVLQRPRPHRVWRSRVAGYTGVTLALTLLASCSLRSLDDLTSAGQAAPSGVAGAAGSGGNAVTAPRSNGAACESSADCLSSHCVDGVCCNTACSDACMSCRGSERGSGADGSCGPVRADTDPDGDCPATAASTCGTSGTCDGAGQCAFHVADTVCAPSSCSAGVKLLASTCDGKGKCVGRGKETCAPAVCSGSVCASDCTNNAECAKDQYCDVARGDCVSRKAVGARCTVPEECERGFCEDGICCDTACAGTCMACINAKTDQATGTCAPVSAGSDPDAECGSEAASTCGKSGVCDGAGACARWADGTSCQQASCTGSTLVQAATCKSGACQSVASSSCAPYLCGGASACLKSCNVNAECVSPNVCSNNICAPAATITSIRITGPSVSGGGGSFKWVTVSETGMVQSTVSPSNSSALYSTTNWTAPIGPPITAGTYFAINGGEGSSSVTRTFEFTLSTGGSVTFPVVSPDGTGNIVLTTGGAPDTQYARFYFDGVKVTWVFGG